MDFCGILFTDCKRQVENKDSGRNAENGCVKPRDIKCTQYAPQTMHFDTIIYDEKRWSDFNEIKRPVVALRPESTLTFTTKDKMNIESYYLPDISGGDLIKEIERLSNRVKELESMTNNSHSSNIINFHERAPAGQEFNAKKHHYTVDNNSSNKKTIRRLLKNNNVIKNKCMAKRDGIERKQYTPVYKKRKSILLSGLKRITRSSIFGTNQNNTRRTSRIAPKRIRSALRISSKKGVKKLAFKADVDRSNDEKHKNIWWRLSTISTDIEESSLEENLFAKSENASFINSPQETLVSVVDVGQTPLSPVITFGLGRRCDYSADYLRMRSYDTMNSYSSQLNASKYTSEFGNEKRHRISIAPIDKLFADDDLSIHRISLSSVELNSFTKASKSCSMIKNSYSKSILRESTKKKFEAHYEFYESLILNNY